MYNNFPFPICRAAECDCRHYQYYSVLWSVHGRCYRRCRHFDCQPVKVIFWAILILIIQQFDGLYLGPKILGEKTGLRPLWVIFSITVGGSLFGVVGMFLGVPCVAVLSYILNLAIEHF